MIKKIDISSCYKNYPALFSTPADIAKYIVDHKVDAPVLLHFIKLLGEKDNTLGLTPTEKKFYFDRFFDYVYDVFRVPVPETYERMTPWLEDYLEGKLILGGLDNVIKSAYESIYRHYEHRLNFLEICNKHNLEMEQEFPEINCFTSIEVNGKVMDYGKDFEQDVIEQFWIRSDYHGGQPYITNDGEAYMSVTVYSDRVYICGCDDFSWTLYTKSQKESKKFAHYLKCAAPVWNFNHVKLIHPKLEFTN
jgi:hypothetical protein